MLARARVRVLVCVCVCVCVRERERERERENVHVCVCACVVLHVFCLSVCFRDGYCCLVNFTGFERWSMIQQFPL